MELSIVTTLYKSRDCLDEFVRRITPCVNELTHSYEIILVNDGCPDGSLEVALRLYQDDAHIRVVDLSRNFGHHAAMLAGLHHSVGQYIYLTNVDLEERPENLKIIWDSYFRNNDTEIDVMYGFEDNRQGSTVKRVLGGWFYYLFNYLSDVKLPKGQIFSRLMSRRYVDALLLYAEREIFIPGLWELAGFNQVPVAIDREEQKSQSSYSFGKRLALAVRAITSFSSKPLVYIFYIGTAISVVSALVIAYVLARKLILGVSVSGWTSLIISLYFLGGLTIFSIGVLGIYLSRVFTEIKRRPTHIVRKHYDHTEVLEFKKPARQERTIN